MSYCQNYNSVSSYTDELNINSSITTSDAYNESLSLIDEDQIVTVNYSNSISNQIKHLLFLNCDPTDFQLNTLFVVLEEFLKVEKIGANILGKFNISGSVEDEIVFTRTSALGVTLLSIDSDGDILFNFTGFKSGFDTRRYLYNEETDFENLIYIFLSK